MAEAALDGDRIRREQREFWSSAAPGWKRGFGSREHLVAAVSQRLVELARIKPGDLVLDIATGLGEPAVTAARAVGPSGRVVATDQAPGMLVLARERVAELGVNNIEFIETHAEELAVGDRRFNAVVCRMGLMFVPDLQRAARRIAQLLVPSGYLATAVWSTADKVPMISVGEDTIRRVANLPPRNPDGPHPLRFGNPAPLVDALKTAGFKDLEIEPIHVKFEWPTAKDFVEQRRQSSAPFRALLSTLPPDKVEELLAAVEDAAGKFADSSGAIRMDNETLCIAAHT